MFACFLARDSIYAIARSVCYRPSVRLSVTRVDQSKTVEVRIRNLHRRVAYDSIFLTLNFTVKFQSEDRERGRRIREGYEEV